MKFESITLSSFNANHEYFICGSCKINKVENDKLQLVVFLDEGIILPDELFAVEINGVEFNCIDLQLDRDIVVGKIKSIDSQMYAKQFNQ